MLAGVEGFLRSTERYDGDEERAQGGLDGVGVAPAPSKVVARLLPSFGGNDDLPSLRSPDGQRLLPPPGSLE